MSLIAKVYHSTDAGAPALSGTTGSLTALLDAILVNGYGTGGGAKDPLGWTIAYTATNKRAYRNDPVLGTGHYLRVDDTATIGNARHAFMRGYETMSDVNTGTGPTPTVAQLANGSLVAKSTTLNSTARPWRAIGTASALYLFIDTATTGIEYANPYFAGDLVSLKPGDLNMFALSSNNLTAFSGTAVDQAFFFANSFQTTPASTMYISRNYQALSGAVSAGLVATGSIDGTLGGSGNAVPHPYPVNNGLLHGRVFVHEAASRPRGYLPGLYAPMHFQPFSDLYVLPDVAGLPAGTDLLACRFMRPIAGTVTPPNLGQVLFDITNEW